MRVGSRGGGCDGGAPHDSTCVAVRQQCMDGVWQRALSHTVRKVTKSQDKVIQKYYNMDIYTLHQ